MELARNLTAEQQARHSELMRTRMADWPYALAMYVCLATEVTEISEAEISEAVADWLEMESESG